MFNIGTVEDMAEPQVKLRLFHSVSLIIRLLVIVRLTDRFVDRYTLNSLGLDAHMTYKTIILVDFNIWENCLKVR